MDETEVPLGHGRGILGRLPDSTSATVKGILMRRGSGTYTTTVSFTTGTLWVSTVSEDKLVS